MANDDSILSRLRPVCRLAPGQDSRSCPSGTAGENNGAPDLGDLMATPAGRAVYFEAVAARYDAEKRGRSVQDALAAFYAVIKPALAKLARQWAAEDDDEDDLDDEDEAEENSMKKSDCGCGGHADESDYDITGNLTPAAQRRRARAELGTPSRFRDDARKPADPRQGASSSTDEREAAARMREAAASQFGQPSIHRRK